MLRMLDARLHGKCLLAGVFLWALASLRCTAQSCNNPLGISTGHLIPTSVSHAEVEQDSHRFAFSARYARLHRTQLPDCWATTVDHYSLRRQYIQVILPRLMRITAVATQGCPSLHCWMKSYTIQYSAVSPAGPFVTLRKNDHTVVMVGNKDTWRVTRNRLRRPIPAMAVRLIPNKFYAIRCLRMELYGCMWTQGATDPLGLSDGRIQDEQFGASSFWPGSHDNSPHWSLGDFLLPSYARLHRLPSRGDGWCAYSSNKDEFIEVDLRSAHIITAIATQGILYHNVQLYVNSFHVQCSMDSQTFSDLTTEQQSKKFIRKGRAHNIVVHRISPPSTCRWVRLTNFTTPFEHFPPCIRLELYGCAAASGCLNVTLSQVSFSKSVTLSASREPTVDAVVATTSAVTMSSEHSRGQTTGEATHGPSLLTTSTEATSVSPTPRSSVATSVMEYMSSSTTDDASRSLSAGKQVAKAETKAAVSPTTHTSASSSTVASNTAPVSAETSPGKLVASDGNLNEGISTHRDDGMSHSPLQTLTKQGSIGNDTIDDMLIKEYNTTGILKVNIDGKGENGTITPGAEDGVHEEVSDTNEIDMMLKDSYKPTAPPRASSTTLVSSEGAVAAKSSAGEDKREKYESTGLEIAVPIALAVGFIILLIAVLVLFCRRDRLKRLAKETPYRHVADPGQPWSLRHKEAPGNPRTDIYAVPTTQRSRLREADSPLYESSPRNSPSVISHTTSSASGPEQTSLSQRTQVPLQRTLATVQPPDFSGRRKSPPKDETAAYQRRQQSFTTLTMDDEEEERYVSQPMMFPDRRSAGDVYENLHDIVN